MNLGVIGAGYVGITTGICLAHLGHKIYLYDIDTEKINKLQNRKMPFFESGLQKLLESGLDSENLKITTNLNNVIQNSDGCFVCVGTPTKENSIDLTQIIESIKAISESIKNYKKTKYVIIIRSTVIPTTSRNHVYPILKEKLSENEFALCVVPEFLREGVALEDFMNPDKIVIGSTDKINSLWVEEIFKNFKDNCEFIHTNFETAELIKYTNNAFFSTLISFSNEISNIAENLSNVDPYQILEALVLDKRITTNKNNFKIVPNLASYLIPGCGFGGSCFPKDVKAILNFANLNKVNTPLLKAVLKINDERPQKMVLLCESILHNLKNKKIAILGITFKPDTDDTRSSPSLDAIKLFIEKDATISIFDPMIKTMPIELSSFQNCTIAQTIEDAIQKSDAVLLFTKWPEFKNIEGDFLKKLMKTPIIIDGRGFLDEEKFQKGTFFKMGHSK